MLSLIGGRFLPRAGNGVVLRFTDWRFLPRFSGLIIASLASIAVSLSLSLIFRKCVQGLWVDLLAVFIGAFSHHNKIISYGMVKFGTKLASYHRSEF